MLYAKVVLFTGWRRNSYRALLKICRCKWVSSILSVLNCVFFIFFLKKSFLDLKLVFASPCAIYIWSVTLPEQAWQDRWNSRVLYKGLVGPFCCSPAPLISHELG